MTDLSQATTQELADELTQRSALPRCGCGRWRTYLGAYDHDGYTLRCRGCLRAVGRCLCG
ncbi:hypothetical protein [Micromonospora sp. NPDC049891]|uniref:hypothetical protein n=1 Tax=Micromonospora sp. NPDC049891 TaxID=3155655 RepID=UPI0033DED69C